MSNRTAGLGDRMRKFCVPIALVDAEIDVIASAAMKYALLAIAGIATGTGLAMSVGCEPQSRLDVQIEEGANAPHANLPAVPTLPQPPAPVTYPDGAFSIYGARHVANRNWSKSVRVRGYITRVYVPYVPGTNPPRVCTERDRCLEEKPHVFIADSATEQDPERQMMVTNYANFQSEIDDARRAAGHAPATPAPANALQAAGLTHTMPTDLYQGAQITVTGTLRRRSTNGMADSRGLLEYASHTTDTPSPTAPVRGHH